MPNLKSEIVNRWEAENRPTWNLDDSIKVALECDDNFKRPPAPKFRLAAEQNNVSYLRKWVRSCRFPWLTVRQKNPTSRGFESERRVRDIMSRKFNKTFCSRPKDRTLIIGNRSSGEPIYHEFDIVSDDRSIIGEVKSYKHTPKAHSNTRFPRVLKDCLYLQKAPAARKMMIFTDEETYLIMKKDLDGIIDSSVEIVLINVNSYL